jgi:hypothetical protein
MMASASRSMVASTFRLRQGEKLGGGALDHRPELVDIVLHCHNSLSLAGQRQASAAARTMLGRRRLHACWAFVRRRLAFFVIVGSADGDFAQSARAVPISARRDVLPLLLSGAGA